MKQLKLFEEKDKYILHIKMNWKHLHKIAKAKKNLLEQEKRRKEYRERNYYD